MFTLSFVWWDDIHGVVYVDSHFDRGIDTDQMDKYVVEKCKRGGVHNIIEYRAKDTAPIRAPKDLDDFYPYITRGRYG